MHYIIGIDIGGSKTEVVIFRADGKFISSGRIDSGENLAQEASIHPFRLGGGRDGRAIHRAIETALMTAEFDDNEVIDLTVSCHMGSFPLNALKGINFGCLTTTYTTEYSPIFEIAGVTHAAFALAGTGASVMCRLPDERAMFMDGAGPDLGDLGGGCYIGKKALVALLKSVWHEKYYTTLKEEIPKALGFKTPAPTEMNHYEELVQYSLRPHDRAQTAGLAKVVAIEAEKGDRIAQDIMIDASNQLSETLSLVIDRLGCGDMELPLITMGSLLAKSNVYWNNFTARVKEFAPNFIPMRTVISPAVGHALIAFKDKYPEEYKSYLREEVLKNGQDINFTASATEEQRREYYSKKGFRYYG